MNIKAVRGFTLIELLVVVLIMSILAAVALPQYQKAVAKARMIQWIALSDAFEKGVEAYILEKGFPTGEDIWEISPGYGGTPITLPVELPETDFTYMAGAESNPQLFTLNANLQISHIDMLGCDRYSNGSWDCFCEGNDKIGVAMCKMLPPKYQCWDLSSSEPTACN